MKFIRDYSVLIKNLLISAEFFYKKNKNSFKTSFFIIIYIIQKTVNIVDKKIYYTIYSAEDKKIKIFLKKLNIFNVKITSVKKIKKISKKMLTKFKSCGIICLVYGINK